MKARVWILLFWWNSGKAWRAEIFGATAGREREDHITPWHNITSQAKDIESIMSFVFPPVPFTGCPVNRSAFNEKSAAALRREQEAIQSFDDFRLEASGSSNAVICTTLLPPNQHLTAPCWKTFRDHVHSFPGWRAKRREATPQEKLASKEKRKGTVYWIDIMFVPEEARPTEQALTIQPIANKTAAVNGKSSTALSLERSAIQSFDKFRLEQGTSNAAIATTLLPPNHHLTGLCWKTFREHVRSFPGWRAKRREATAEERLASQAKRKGKVYWVNVTFDPITLSQDVADARQAAVAFSGLVQPTAVVGATPVVDTKRPASNDVALMEPSAKKVKVLQDFSMTADQDEGAAARITP